MLDYADGLKAAGVPGHTVQIDDKWESNYGNFTFDTTKFPDPKGLSDHIHGLGFDVGLWVTLWLNTDSASYPVGGGQGLPADGRRGPEQGLQRRVVERHGGDRRSRESGRSRLVRGQAA